MIHESIMSLAVPLDSLRPYEHNPRRGKVEVVRQSLETNGQYRPIVVNRPGSVILAGNHTYAAARELGWTQIAATFVDVDDVAAKKILVVDNRASDLAANDLDVLAELLGELDGLEGTGFTEDDVHKLLGGTVPESTTDSSGTHIRWVVFPGRSAPREMGVAVELLPTLIQLVQKIRLAAGLRCGAVVVTEPFAAIKVLYFPLRSFNTCQDACIYLRRHGASREILRPHVRQVHVANPLAGRATVLLPIARPARGNEVPPDVCPLSADGALVIQRGGRSLPAVDTQAVMGRQYQQMDMGWMGSPRPPGQAIVVLHHLSEFRDGLPDFA